MTKYLVKRPWHGVKVGDIIETESLHAALLPHVEPIKDDRSLEVATPKPTQTRESKGKAK